MGRDILVGGLALPGHTHTSFCPKSPQSLQPCANPFIKLIHVRLSIKIAIVIRGHQKFKTVSSKDVVIQQHCVRIPSAGKNIPSHPAHSHLSKWASSWGNSRARLKARNLLRGMELAPGKRAATSSKPISATRLFATKTEKYWCERRTMQTEVVCEGVYVAYLSWGHANSHAVSALDLRHCTSTNITAMSTRIRNQQG